MGWYVDFLQAETTGERSIDSGVLAGGQVFLNTLLPASDPCAKPRSRTYALNVLTGLDQPDSVVPMRPAPTSTEQPVGQTSDDYRSTPSLLPVTSSKTPPDPTGRMHVLKELAVANVTPHGSVDVGRIKVPRRAGRLSWREVGNWRQLHEAAK